MYIQKMFTLGDVADILDSALDTGISIVDALAKLSDLADEASLSSAKIELGNNLESDNDCDENGNIVDCNEKLLSSILSDDQFDDDSGVCSSGNSLNYRVKNPAEIGSTNVSGNKVSNNFQRCGTYVLNAENVDDKNKCHVADKVLKCNQKDYAEEELSNKGCTSSEKLDVKVNDMFQSFQKLDETVQKLKQQAIHRHLMSHPEDLHLFTHPLSFISGIEQFGNLSNPSLHASLSKHKDESLQSEFLPLCMTIDKKDEFTSKNLLCNDLQESDLFTRQTSQETYILDDVEVEEEFNSISSNNISVLKSKTINNKIMHDGLLKSPGNESNIQMDVNTLVTDNDFECERGASPFPPVTSLFDQEKGTADTLKMVPLKKHFNNTFDRKASCRNTYVLHSNPNLSNDKCKHIDSVMVNNQRQTYVLTQIPKDVQVFQELQDIPIQMKRGEEINHREGIKLCSEKTDFNCKVTKQSESFVSSNIRSTYLLSKANNDSNKEKKRKNESCPSKTNNPESKSTFNSRSTYVLLDSNKNRHVKKKPVKKKQLNFDFIKNAQLKNNNEVMFYLGKKERLSFGGDFECTLDKPTNLYDNKSSFNSNDMSENINDSCESSIFHMRDRYTGNINFHDNVNEFHLLREIDQSGSTRSVCENPINKEKNVTNLENDKAFEEFDLIYEIAVPPINEKANKETTPLLMLHDENTSSALGRENTFIKDDILNNDNTSQNSVQLISSDKTFVKKEEINFVSTDDTNNKSADLMTDASWEQISESFEFSDLSLSVSLDDFFLDETSDNSFDELNEECLNDRIHDSINVITEEINDTLREPFHIYSRAESLDTLLERYNLPISNFKHSLSHPAISDVNLVLSSEKNKLYEQFDRLHSLISSSLTNLHTLNCFQKKSDYIDSMDDDYNNITKNVFYCKEYFCQKAFIDNAEMDKDDKKNTCSTPTSIHCSPYLFQANNIYDISKTLSDLCFASKSVPSSISIPIKSSVNRSDTFVVSPREESPKKSINTSGVSRNNTFLIDRSVIVRRNLYSNVKRKQCLGLYFDMSVPHTRHSFNNLRDYFVAKIPLSTYCFKYNYDGKKKMNLSDVCIDNIAQTRCRPSFQYPISSSVFYTSNVYNDYVKRNSYTSGQINQDDEDETLSIQLPALQMQLEEKKLQFDEENKRKQEQWREECAKSLQNAFFVMVNNKEEDLSDVSLGSIDLDNLSILSTKTAELICDNVAQVISSTCNIAGPSDFLMVKEKNDQVFEEFDVLLPAETDDSKYVLQKVDLVEHMISNEKTEDINVLQKESLYAKEIAVEKIQDYQKLANKSVANLKTPNTTSFVVETDLMSTPGLTPVQMKKRERFLRQRQKNMKEERERKSAEKKKLEKVPDKIVKEIHSKDLDGLQDLGCKNLDREQNVQELSAKRGKHDFTVSSSGTLQHSANTISRPQQLSTAPRTPQHPSTNSSNKEPDESSRYTEYSGPEAYKKPSGKSNRKIIQNAIIHCCLCGEVNKESKKKCLDALDKSDAQHFLVLFREGLKFRSVYEYHPETEMVLRIYGIGPKSLSAKIVTKFYKYNSGGKEFYSLETKHLSIQVDGLMIKKELWGKRQPNSSKTDSNLKKGLSNMQ